MVSARGSARCFCMTTKLACLLVIPLLAVSLHAQDQSQEPTAGATPTGGTTVDCSDPLMANSAQCGGTYSGVNPMYPGYSTGLNANTVQGLPSSGSTYTDNEPFYRQYGSYQARRPLPPEPLTEFQKFVASTTSQVLPIFGASLFRNVPSTFAPLDMTPVPPDHVIGPGDELRIRVWGQINFRADVRVDRTGDIYLPQVGEVHVAGMPFSELDEHLREAVGRVYRNFDLTADVGQIRAIQIYVSGQARAPGLYTVSSLSTLVDALFTSGGPSASGSLRDIQVRRGGKDITHFDLYALLIHGDKSNDVPLQSGDVIFIPPVGPQAAVTGSVRNPAIYELRPGESLGDVLADAGGVSAVAAQTHISIERIDEHRDRFAVDVDYNKTGLGTALADGDLVQVYSILPKYQKTVTLRGNTANPGRFAWHAGMHISELIPDKASLVTRNYWWKRAELGLPGPEFEPLQNFPTLMQPSRAIDLNRRRFLGMAPLVPPSTSSSTSTNGTTSTQPATPGTSSTTPNAQTGSDQYATDQYPYDVYSNQSYAGEQYDQTGATGAAAAQPATPTGTSSTPTGPDQGPTQSTGSGTVASEQSAMGPRNNPLQRTEVGPIAPDIDWDYAVIERLDPTTLKTSLIPFDLGKLVMQHDESQDLVLQPGDVVTVFSQADIREPIAQQTKFVRLDGEFVHAGTYTVKPGETLRDLVREAGGFTPNAYLYGSEFTRESTRIAQQRRLDEYIQTLELEIQHGNLAIISSPASSAQDIASGSAAQTSEQALLSQLRRMRATGRIVLEFHPGSSGLDSLPDITLEDGDRFVVPSKPASVNVVGAVYDQNSFLYEASRRAGNYLRLAGGPNRDADQKHAFIIRADGSVISRDAESGIWGNEFDSLRMNPGDTLVVPEKTFKPSAMRGFLDYSQLFSQFAFGAAALSIIY